MLWFRLLQNTTYCDTLESTTYRIYGSVKERLFARERRKLAGKSRLLEAGALSEEVSPVGLKFAPTSASLSQLATPGKRKGGLLWIAPSLL